MFAERGIFSAIFGTLISFGVYFAFDWGQAIVDMAKANPSGKVIWLQNLIQKIFAIEGRQVDAIWAVFFIPAAILMIWIVLDWWLIKDTPEEANFPHWTPTTPPPASCTSNSALWICSRKFSGAV
jgi:OPA family glycerol-3-phosphate transporter-like MFS transporter